MHIQYFVLGQFLLRYPLWESILAESETHCPNQGQKAFSYILEWISVICIEEKKSILPLSEQILNSWAFYVLEV